MGTLKVVWINDEPNSTRELYIYKYFIGGFDCRYLQLSGGTETGLVKFNAGLNSSTIITGTNNSGTDSVAISYTNNLSNWTLNSQTALNSNSWTSVCWSA